MNQIEEVKALICAPKYLDKNEDFRAGMTRIADHLKDNEMHFKECREILLDRRFLPAGRIQASAGSTRQTTAYNCFVSDTIEDSSESIFERLGQAFQTMRLGGGDGFDFSNIRPKNSLIKTLDSNASGPVSFMRIWDAMCQTVKSAGHRRGAMMATLRIDHPDIEEFITCKQKAGELTNFNISVLVTDHFMEVLKRDGDFQLVFEGRPYKTVRATQLWNLIMRNTWSHAEPGVIFIDKVNRKNNLYYCEKISATNPCGEQPLPPNGACLLGSFNLVRYCEMDEDGLPFFNFDKLIHDIAPIHRMMDNVIDRTIYPLPEQELEAKNKRRMGLGITGLANTFSFLGYKYGDADSLIFTEKVLKQIRNTVYMCSINLAIEKGSFPLFNAQAYARSEFVQTLPSEIQELIKKFGIRNSHLLSIAPTGTISLWAGNVSSGIEPVFSIAQHRKIFTPSGELKQFYLEDYAFSEWGLEGEISENITAEEHINVLCLASKYVDSACSKTCNVGDEVVFEDFKNLYLKAYEGGASGCTTFRPSALKEKFGAGRGSVLENAKKSENFSDESGPACTINPETGERSCSD